MQSKRDYLKSKGITVGARGRFSGAAKQALADAARQGIQFSDEKTSAKK